MQQSINTWIQARSLSHWIATPCSRMVLPATEMQGERVLLSALETMALSGRTPARKSSTCPSAWIQALATAFREEFGASGEVAINRPFSGGFITNAHFCTKGIPWIRVEVNRDLYERGEADSALSVIDPEKLNFTGERIWNALCSFWDGLETSEHCIDETIQ